MSLQTLVHDLQKMIILCRTPWIKGASQSRTASNEDNQLSTRSRDLQCRGSEETALLQPPPRKAPGAAVSERARAPEDLLLEARRPGTGSATHREYVRCQLTVLISVRTMLLNYDYH